MLVRIMLVIFAVITAQVFAAAFGQEEGGNTEPKQTCVSLFGNCDFDAETFTLTTDFPKAPAFAVIDQDPTALQNVRNLEDLGMQVLGGLDGNGALDGEGISFGARPFWLGDRSNLTLSDYSRDDRYFFRLYQRSHFSVATASEELESGDSIWRAGIAITTELFDDQDIRYNPKDDPNAALGEFETCMVENGASFRAAAAKTDLELNVEAARQFASQNDWVSTQDLLETDGEPVATRDQIIANLVNAAMHALASGQLPQSVDYYLQQFSRLRAELETNQQALDLSQSEQVFTKCVEQREEALLKTPSLKIGIAHALTSESGQLDDFNGEATSIWISGRYPADGLIKNGAVTGFLQYDNDRLLEVTEEAMNEIGPPEAPMTSDMDMGDSSASNLMEADRVQANIGFGVRNDDWTISASVSYVDVNFKMDDMEDEEYTLYSASVARKLRPGMWLEFGLGASDSDRLESSEYANLRLKIDWGQVGA